MKPIKLLPRNSLEVALEKSQLGELSLPDFLSLLVLSDLYIVSTEIVSDGAKGLHPLLFDRSGVPMAAVYTDSARTDNNEKERIKSVVKMKGADILKNIPPGYGVVINPGFDLGLELLPEGVRNVVDNFCKDI